MHPEDRAAPGSILLRSSTLSAARRAATPARRIKRRMPLIPIAVNVRNGNSRLSDLMNNPSSILERSAFKASLNLGLENVSRMAGASGMGLSGNRLASLQQYGQTAGYNAIQTKLGNLEDLAGVKSGSPAAAAAAIQKGTENTKSDLAGGLSGIDKILGQIFGTGACARDSSRLQKAVEWC